MLLPRPGDVGYVLSLFACARYDVSVYAHYGKTVPAITRNFRSRRSLLQCAVWWLVHWPLTAGLLHLVQRGGVWAVCGPVQSPLLAVPNV